MGVAVARSDFTEWKKCGAPATGEVSKVSDTDEAKRQSMKQEADRGLIDFAEAIHRLETTTFRKPIPLLQALLDKHKIR